MSDKTICAEWDARSLTPAIDALAVPADLDDAASVKAALGDRRLFVTLPLDYVEAPRPELVADVAQRIGAIDLLVLTRPVLLHADPAQNAHDHLERLVVAWQTMEALVREGVVRRLGIRHAGRLLLESLLARCDVPPAIDQLEHHAYAADDALLKWCHEHAIGVHALHPLGPDRGPVGRPLLAEPGVTAERCVAWSLRDTDGVVLSAGECALVGDAASSDVSALDGLRCDARQDRDASTLASLYGNTSPLPVRVVDEDTSRLTHGYYKILYAQVSRSEATNKRFSERVWRYAFNPVASSVHRAFRPQLSAVARRIVDDLDRDGFALSSVDELGCRPVFEALRDRDEAVAPRDGDYREEREDRAAAGLATPDLRRAIDAYFGMKTILDGAFLNTIRGRREEARFQQLWHSDVEDFFVVKAFTYLTDVGEDSGPLEYIAGTHPKGELAIETAELWKRTFVQDPTPTHTFQVSNELLFRHVRPDRLRRFVGPAGTVVVLDARGLHRGGHVVRGVRRIALTSHLSPNQVHPWPLRLSLWNLVCRPFRWQTNVQLKRP